MIIKADTILFSKEKSFQEARPVRSCNPEKKTGW